MIEINQEHIDEFVRQARRVGKCGLTICSSGNLSWRIDDKVLLSGTGSWVPELTADRVAVVSLADGKTLNGVRPTMESTFHLGVLRQRPDVNVVLHFQSPYATALACRKTLPATLNFTAEVPLHVGDTIPAIPFLRPGSKELADAVVEAMADHNSVILKKHGQVTCGKDFNQAIERAMFFEMAARIAVVNGSDIDPLTTDEIDDLEEYFLGKRH
ncbi:MAG: class II aldolase/adducin family protein [Paramuribaculum sp.]|nr:class II aldolase/adducin family protein [Paramuribaculum sp.]